MPRKAKYPKREFSFVDKIANEVARYHHWFMSPLEAKQKAMHWPAQSQLLRNPGMLKSWSVWVDGKLLSCPKETVGCNAYVDFGGQLANNQILDGDIDGWKALRVAIQQHIDGLYNNGAPPTLRTFLDRFMPDWNPPLLERISADLGVGPDDVLKGKQDSCEMSKEEALRQAKQMLGPSGAVRFTGEENAPCRIGILEFKQISEGKTWEEAVIRCRDARSN